MSTIHRKKFADGRESPQEMHQRVAWHGKRCLGCGGPPAIQIRVLAPIAELTRLAPGVMAAIAASNSDHPGAVPSVPTKYGAMMVTSETCYCRLCASAAERAAARGPSWTIVEIDRGPDPKQRVTVGMT